MKFFQQNMTIKDNGRICIDTESYISLNPGKKGTLKTLLLRVLQYTLTNICQIKKSSILSMFLIT